MGIVDKLTKKRSTKRATDEVSDVVVVGLITLRGRAPLADAGSGATGVSRSAPAIAAAKILAGNDPPVTERPRTEDIGRFGSKPFHTAVDSCGT